MRTKTYLGLLDDFALRHQLTGACPADVKALNDILLTQVFIGPPLIINDGYFVMHPAVHQAITDPTQSPLCRLTEGSFITILTRNDGRLENLVEDMAEKDITTGRSLLKSRFYKVDFKRKLEIWVSTLQSAACNSFQKWPLSDMDECFFRTLKMGFKRYLLHQSEEKRESAQRLWQAFASAPQNRRTEWEDIAEIQLQRKNIDNSMFRELMALGNEAYQYSWASALTNYNDDLTIRAETNASAFFLDLHETPDLSSDDPFLGFSITLPALNTAFAKKHIRGRWELVSQMLESGHKVNIAKHEFMDRLAEYPIGHCSYKDITEASKNYSDKLSQQFKTDLPKLQFSFDLTTLIGSSGVGLAVGGPAGAALGFSMGLLGVGAAHGWPGPKIFDWASTPNQKKWFDGLQTTFVDKATTSLKINVEKAREHLDGVTEYSD